MPKPAGIIAALAAACALSPAAARADTRIYSYEAGSPAARALAETGLSFQFEQHVLGGTRIERIMQTGERGSADVRPASEKDLGPGGLKAALGAEKPVGGLYRISGEEDGQAFVNAVCPGADKAWLVIGSLKRFTDLTVQAIGKDPGAQGAKRCVTLRFSFRSDWRLPERDPPRIRFSTRGQP